MTLSLISTILNTIEAENLNGDEGDVLLQLARFADQPLYSITPTIALLEKSLTGYATGRIEQALFSLIDKKLVKEIDKRLSPVFPQYQLIEKALKATGGSYGY
jgi:hypothetical protein